MSLASSRLSGITRCAADASGWTSSLEDMSRRTASILPRLLAILSTVSSRCKSLALAEPSWSVKPLCALPDLFFDIAETMSEAFAIWQRPESSPFRSEKQDLGLIYLSFSL